MADCSTFDACVVDWLYDELDPGARARFAGHIEGCAACRHTVESLSWTRALMRALPEEAPPDAVSARVLHEASGHRHRARPGLRGLWARLIGLLELAGAHPAAAAAATLVLVVGVAGALMMRGTMQVASPQVTATDEVTRAGAVAPDMAAVTMREAPEDDPAAGNHGVRQEAKARGSASVRDARSNTASSADRAEAREQGRRRLQPATSARAHAVEEQAVSDLLASGAARGASSRPRRPRASASATPRLAGSGAGSLERGATQQAPEADAEARAPDPESAAPGARDERRAEISSRAGEGAAAPQPRARAQERASDRDGTRSPRARRDDAGSAWIRSMHQKLRAALRAGECARAVAIAEDIRARDPDRYRSDLARSKELAACRRRSRSPVQTGQAASPSE